MPNEKHGCKWECNDAYIQALKCDVNFGSIKKNG